MKRLVQSASFSSKPTSAGTLHLVSNATDEVCSFLAPATRELSIRGHRQTVVLINSEDNRTNIQKLREYATLVLVKKGRVHACYRDLYHACCRELSEHRYSTIHLHGLIPCVLGSLALKRSSTAVKVLYSPHGSRSITTLPLMGWMIMQLARPLIRPSRAAAIATFPHESNSLASWGSTHLIESPVNDTFLNCRRSEKSDPLILCGGTHANQHTVDTISQLAVLLSAEELKITFEWLGEAKLTTADCFRAAGVRMTGIESEAIHAAKLSQGWVYVAPWWTRGYPLFLIQAMASGLPSVVLDCPQHRHLIEHEKTGFLCASEEEMVGTIARLLDDSALRRRIGDDARASARERFESSAFRLKLLKSYAKPIA